MQNILCKEIMKKIDSTIEKLRATMIVSCQAEGDDPFNENPMYMGLFARAAEMGGAKGIRTQGVEQVREIRKVTDLPIFGLIKSKFEDGTVCITRRFSDVEQLLLAGSDIVAIDGTQRICEEYSGPDFIREVKKRYGCLVLADIATCQEAILCEEAGTDCISTALNGYTLYTRNDNEGPNLVLLEDIVSNVNIPVFAEGRYNVPEDAQNAMKLGAFAIITGTAITRPRVVTSWFVDAIKEIKNNNNEF